jgi:hypothetical protein
MNEHLLSVVKQIITDNGEAIFADPARLKAFFSDLAKDEPKPLRMAFGRCVEAGAYDALKTAADQAERISRKAAIAQRVLDEHGLDVGLCGEALDILEAALFGTASASQQYQPPPPYQPAPPYHQPAPYQPPPGPPYQQSAQDRRMKKRTKAFIAVLGLCLVLVCAVLFAWLRRPRGTDEILYVPESDPLVVLPEVVDDDTDADIIEVPIPEPWQNTKGETVYPIYYRGETAVTLDREEWESWLRDPSLAPLPTLHNNRSFVLTWCHQFAQHEPEPEEVGLMLMNYFEFDWAYLDPANPYYYWTPYPQFWWAGLRKCIEDKKTVCAGYAQLFYLIVKERYPKIKYITAYWFDRERGKKIAHARNLFEDTGEQWDITWLDDRGEDYNPDKIKFDFVGMQKRMAGTFDVGWEIKNLVEGQRPY